MANTLELEGLAWPCVSLFTSFLSGLLFIIAMATPGWFRIDFEMSGQARGNMTFGIIQGREIIDGANGELLQDATFYTFERFNNAINLSSLYILLLCLLLTIPLSLVNLCVEFINTYQVVKEWWKGPPSIYVISLAIVVLASLSAAVSSDFYIVDLTDSQNIYQMINSTSVSANLQGYEGTASLQYSAYIFYVGACLAVLPILFSWRLTMLLPVYYTIDVLETMKLEIPEKFEMVEFHDEREYTDDEEEEEEEEEEYDEEYEDEDEDEVDEEDEEDEEESEEEIQLDSYRYPVQGSQLKKKPAAGGYLTYQ